MNVMVSERVKSSLIFIHCAIKPRSTGASTLGAIGTDNEQARLHFN